VGTIRISLHPIGRSMRRAIAEVKEIKVAKKVTSEDRIEDKKCILTSPEKKSPDLLQSRLSNGPWQRPGKQNLVPTIVGLGIVMI
jgi:hypothetical protein